jgi:K+-sensing histidine kinase KdpD
VRKLHSGYHFTFDDSVFPKDIYLITITGNESLLKVAFINLLENACKFSPDHSAGIRIFNTSSHEVCVEISDTAPTLSPQEKEWIFKPFFRTEHSKNIQGSGIGLSLVHSILSLHQARLLIVEKADTGNVFQVFFSLLSEKESENLHE